MEVYKPKEQFRITGITSALERRVQGDFLFPGEAHPSYELLYLKRGLLEVIEDEKNYVMGEGQIICHAPGEFHRIKRVGEGGAHLCVISFTIEGEMPRDVDSGVFSLNPEIAKAFEEAFYALHFFIWEKTQGAPSSEWCVSDRPSFKTVGDPDKIGQKGLALLSAFLISLSYENPMESTAAAGRLGDYSAIVRLMTERVNDGLELSDIAALHHSSPSYITKLFLEYAGEGPMKYYSRLRLSAAKAMLKSGVSVCDVAERMSFSCPAYFSSFFKKGCGISPTEWLKSEHI